MRPATIALALALAVLAGGAGCHGGGSSAAPFVPLPSPTITTTSSLPSATVSVAYSVTLTASSGTAPFAWTVSAGSLPAGLSLGLVTGRISGSPTAAGSVSFTARVTDSLLQTSTKAFSLTVNAASNPTITSTGAFPSAFIGEPFSITLTATGTAPLTWSFASGAALPGTVGTLHASTGVIDGTPTTSGTVTFTAVVTDGNGNVDAESLSLTVFPGGIIYVRQVDFNDAQGAPSPITFRVQPAISAVGSVSPTATIQGLFTGQRVSESGQMFVDEDADRLWFPADDRPAGGGLTQAQAVVVMWPGVSTADGTSVSGIQGFDDLDDDMHLPASVAVDVPHDIVYVNDVLTPSSNSALRVYSGFDTRGAVPQDLTATAVILGPLSNFNGSNIGLFLDGTTDSLYVADGGMLSTPTAAIKVFNNISAHVNDGPTDLAPDRTLTGVTTTLDNPLNAVVDTGRDILYVADAGGFLRNGPVQILIYDNASTVDGDIAPTRRIIAPATGTDNTTLGTVSNTIDIALYPERDELYVVNSANATILVFDHASTADGNVAPARVISSTAFTAASGALIGIAIDRKH